MSTGRCTCIYVGESWHRQQGREALTGRVCTRLTDGEVAQGGPRGAGRRLRSPAAMWLRRATLIEPKPKKAVSIRLDEDILDWLQAPGPRLSDPYERHPESVRRIAGMISAPGRRLSI